ncbi:MAG: SDR family oxidoreductase [Bacteroidaceae bacterium]|nr:SDR family oxidoreductase [Bacteroidaceae bacterium]
MGITYNPFSLEGKKILVTGASSGIGKTTAIECSKMGAKLVITARNEERLNQTLSEMEGEGHVALIGDLTKEDDVKSLVSSMPELDGVIYNAGVGITVPLAFIKDEDLYRVFETNLFSTMKLNKALLRKKRIKKSASLVFTSSISALFNTPGISLYGSTKAALLSYMRSCACELADRKIRVNAVLPGMIQTDLINGGTLSEDDKARDMATYPLKRYGTPYDVAYAFIYLLSDASSWVTGTSLIVDGGKLMR